MAFYELRQYKILPGRMDDWLELMEQEIIPFQVAKGMVITGSYRGEDDDSVYVWMRRFESEEQREVETVSRTRRSTSGHVVDTHLQLVVCNWLYRAGLVHAFQRALPVEEEIYADFYVPAASLVIECWEQDVPTLTLARRLRVREVCREIDMPYLELTNADESRLEQVLGSKLRDLGALS